MRKYFIICFLVFFVFCDNKPSKEKELLQENKLPDYPFLVSFQEPVGDVIKEYNFYMMIQHYSAFGKFNIFSIQKIDERIATFLKTTNTINLRILNEQSPSSEVVSYETLYRPISKSDFAHFYKYLVDSNLEGFNNTKGTITSITDGEFYDIFIYKDNKVIKIKRFGNLDDMENQISGLIKLIQKDFYKLL